MGRRSEGDEGHPKTAYHSHHAVQVTLGLRGSFTLEGHGRRASGVAAAVAPNVEHAFEADELIAHLFVDPEGWRSCGRCSRPRATRLPTCWWGIRSAVATSSCSRELSADGTDAFRTRAAVGAHAGMFLGGYLSLGADLLYQRSLSHPTELDMIGAQVPIADADLARVTVSAGVRMHFHVVSTSVHPGLSYTRGLGASEHGPMITNRTNAVAFDLAVLF